MKKLAYLVVIVSLPVLLYFQYRSFIRFNPPESIGFIPSDSIDVAFYNPLFLKEYYQLSTEIPAFVRRQWSEHGIDVRYPDDSEEAILASDQYNDMLSSVQQIETILKHAFLLKQQGLDNKAIRKIQEEGWSLQGYQLQNLEGLIGIEKGDTNSAVWELQKLLRKQGYNIPQDGIFDIETENALKALQTKYNHYPSGIVEKMTLSILIKE